MEQAKPYRTGGLQWAAAAPRAWQWLGQQRRSGKSATTGQTAVAADIFVMYRLK